MGEHSGDIVEPTSITNQTNTKQQNNKTQSNLLSEIFGESPKKEIEDDRISVEFGKVTDTSKSTSNMQSYIDEYRFVDDSSIENQTKLLKNSLNTPENKYQPKNTTKLHSNKPTNLEALELETEQTLKDINRWLEHTPRFTDFNSRSNSPSRFNLLDDFDSVCEPTPTVDNHLKSITIDNTTECVSVERANKWDNSLVSLNDIVSEEINILDQISMLDNSDNPSKFVSQQYLPNTLNDVSSRSNTPPVTTLKSLPLNAVQPKATQLIGMMPAPRIQRRDAKKTMKKTQLQEKQLSKKRPCKELVSSSSTFQQRPPLSKSKPTTKPLTALKSTFEGQILSFSENAAENVETSDKLVDSGQIGKIHEIVSPCQKTKEIKNSLMQPENENGPKLNLGSVLKTDAFGLGIQHNFCDEKEKGKI